MSRSALCLLLWVLSTLVAGCPTPVHYQPSDKLVDQLGVSQVKQRMEDVLSRAVEPNIIDLDVTDTFLRYRYPLAYLMGFPSGKTSAEKQITYQDVNDVEVFENHVVIVRKLDKTILEKLIFTKDQDAKAFVNLLFSLRAYSSTMTSNKH